MNVKSSGIPQELLDNTQVCLNISSMGFDAEKQSRQQQSLENINEKFASAAELIIKYRIFIILGSIVLFILAILGLTHLRISVSVDSFFLPDDPLVAKRAEFEEIFENNDFIGVLIESEDVFSSETLQLIHDLSRDLQENVPYTNSIVSIPTTSPTLLGGMSFSFSGDTLSSTSAEIEELRSRFDKRKSLRGVLYSEDYERAWILVRLDAYPDTWVGKEEPAMHTGRKAMEVVEQYQAEGVNIIPTGVPVVAFRKSQEMFEDLVRILVIAGVVAFIFILVMIRTPMGVLGSLVVTGGSIITVFGCLGWFHIPADTTFMLVPMLLTIAATVGYTVHVSNFFKRRMRQTGKRKESVIYALRETGWPVLFTALTTIVALLSFIFVSIYPIQWVGLVSSVSIGLVYLLIMLLFCALLSLGPDKETTLKERNIRERKSNRAFRYLGAFLVKNGKIFVPILGVLLLACIFFGRTLEVNLNTDRIMGTKLPHSRDQIYISSTDIGVIMSYDIALQFNTKDETVNLETLNKLDELAGFIEEFHLVKGTRSLNQSLKEVNQITHRDNPASYTLPSTDSSLRGLINYYSRLPGNDLHMWLSDEQTDLRLTVYVYELSSSEIADHIKAVEEKINELFPEQQYPGRNSLITGGLIQMSMMNQYVTHGLILSVGTALLAITIIMMIVFRSVKLGLIAMIPNVAPIIVAGGLMGLFNIELEFVTMTIAPMLLGLAVDDTIHVINHTKLEFARSGNYNSAISETFQAVGKAISQTTFIICATFAVFMFSRVRSMVHMGVFTMAGIFAALVADFIMTPVLIKWTKPFGPDKSVKQHAEVVTT